MKTGKIKYDIYQIESTRDFLLLKDLFGEKVRLQKDGIYIADCREHGGYRKITKHYYIIDIAGCPIIKNEKKIKKNDNKQEL